MYKRLFAAAFTGLACMHASAVDPQALVANPANACQAKETRDACFVRTTVQLVPRAPVGKSPYRVVNSPLSCPAGYRQVPASLDNRLMDPGRPADLIYQYGASTFSPGSYPELDQARRTYACKGTPAAMYTTPIEGGCDKDYTPAKVIDGRLALKMMLDTWQMDTSNWGPTKCQHYTLPGCPSWCSRWTWARLEYTAWSCTREAGAYPASLSTGQKPSDGQAPSTIVCSKS